jgi:NAD(P)-dependent dehydrogenase (short-subunit alcohol dehydrogenase family)
MDKSLTCILKKTLAAGAVVWTARAAVRRFTGYDFAGRSVLITGGSRGLGLVLARQLADLGSRIAICARNAHDLERARTDLASRGAEVAAFECDVTRPADVERMVDQASAQFGGIDVVINNAGIIQFGPMDSMKDEDYEEALATHFHGPYHVVEAVLPQMRERQEGRIVNIASIGGRISVPHLLPYTASKYALVGYSLGLRAELARQGIVVTTICPGLMRTGSPRNAWFKGQRRAEYAWFKVSGSLPLFTLSAERAAAQIIDACRHGDAYRVLGMAACLSDKLQGLCPGLAARVLGAVNCILPAPNGDLQKYRGYQSESALSSSLLTALTQKAAMKNNEYPEAVTPRGARE